MWVRRFGFWVANVGHYIAGGLGDGQGNQEKVKDVNNRQLGILVDMVSMFILGLGIGGGTMACWLRPDEPVLMVLCFGGMALAMVLALFVFSFFVK